MRILVVSPYYAPDLGPSAPLLKMLCEDLVNLGHQVTVLAAVPHFPSGWTAPGYRRRAWRWEQCNGVRVGRAWVPSGDRTSLGHRLRTFIVYQVLACLVGFGLEYDVIALTNPALETGLTFVLLAWLRRKPSAYCVWDLYPEVGVQLGVFRHVAVVRVVKAMEDFCLRRASVVQSLAEGFVPNLSARMSPGREPVVILPWMDTEFVRPLPRRNSFSGEHGLHDSFVVLYAGNLGLSQGLDKVMLAARALSLDDRILFVFVGDGVNRENLIRQADELGLKNVKFIPFQPRERLPEVLASADLALVSLSPGIGVDSLPSKTFPILASGRPILAVVEEQTDLWQLVQRSGAGVCVPPDDVDALANAVLVLAEDPERRGQLGQRAREYAIGHHSHWVAASQFEDLLDEVAAS